MLEIKEPGQSIDRSPVVGIDLGTTHSLVAISRENTVEILTDEQGRALLPSVVYYPKEADPVVGYAARRDHRAPAAVAQLENGERRQSSRDLDTVYSIKRLMGRGEADVEQFARHELFRFMGNRETIRLRVGGKNRTPMDISADILTALKKRAEEALGEEVYDAVITVPAHFDEAQRQATKDAARLAGLNVLRLLTEPTAAALAYGLDSKAEGHYLVYDMGGGTFDVSLLKLTKGVFQVIATGGDTWLGGDDMDRAIAEYLEDCGGVFPDRQQAARTLKEQLSDVDKARTGVHNFVYTLTRSELEEIIAPLVNRTVDITHNVIKDAGSKIELQGIVLAGGATRMPLVRKKLAQAFNLEPLHDLDPDEVVVRGAALQAEALTQGSGTLLLDVTPLSLGLETVGQLVEKVIARNTPIPISRAQEFTTFKDDQNAMDIHIVQGERETVADCRSLARFKLTGIPPMPAGQARIKVIFTLDADGLLTITAREETTGNEQQVEVKPTYGLEEEEILAMLKEAFTHAADDVEQRQIREAHLELERLCDACMAALTADAHLLEDGEAADLHAALEQAKKELATHDAELLHKVANQLDETFRPFSEKRMNAALQQSVVGKKAADVA